MGTPLKPRTKNGKGSNKGNSNVKPAHNVNKTNNTERPALSNDGAEWEDYAYTASDF